MRDGDVRRIIHLRQDVRRWNPFVVPVDGVIRRAKKVLRANPQMHQWPAVRATHYPADAPPASDSSCFVESGNQVSNSHLFDSLAADHRSCGQALVDDHEVELGGVDVAQPGLLAGADRQVSSNHDPLSGFARQVLDGSHDHPGLFAGLFGHGVPDLP